MSHCEVNFLSRRVRDGAGCVVQIFSVEIDESGALSPHKLIQSHTGPTNVPKRDKKVQAPDRGPKKWTKRDEKLHRSPTHQVFVFSSNNRHHFSKIKSIAHIAGTQLFSVMKILYIAKSLSLDTFRIIRILCR